MSTENFINVKKHTLKKHEKDTDFAVLHIKSLIDNAKDSIFTRFINHPAWDLELYKKLVNDKLISRYNINSRVEGDKIVIINNEFKHIFKYERS